MPDQENNASRHDSLTGAEPRWALITGSARRIGAEIARTLHTDGFNIYVHYRSSSSEADALTGEMNDRRPASAALVKGDLLDAATPAALVQQCLDVGGRLDVLINNASSYYPTPLGSITESQWDDLVGSNLKAPLFLSQASAPHLSQAKGCIVNMLDIHAQAPLEQHSVYCAAKAGLDMLTRSLAKDLAPHVRVNGIAPGSILWPEPPPTERQKAAILQDTPMARVGQPRDIAECALYLIRASYVTGQIVKVDGGRSL